MPTTAPCRTAPTNADSVTREFRLAYADALPEVVDDATWRRASAIRRLRWKGAHRLSLAAAARVYAQIANYNEFDPKMLADLYAAFPGKGITVTPARESSVAVYLHIPDRGDLRQRVERFVREYFQADEVAWVRRGTLRVWWD